MKFQKMKGLTVIELMVTISILSIVATVAVPSMSEFIENNRIDAQRNDFAASILESRGEALSRNQNIVLCKSSDGASCTTSDNWEQGWLSYIDENANGSKDSTETIVGAHGGLKQGFTLRTDTAFADKVIFLADGSLANAGIFRLCSDASGTAKAVSVALTLTGRPRYVEGATTCP